MAARVEGLGPRFRLLLTVTNEGDAAVGGLAVVVRYDPEQYRWGELQVGVLPEGRCAGKLLCGAPQTRPTACAAPLCTAWGSAPCDG